MENLSNKQIAIFTNQADLAFNELINKFELQETPEEMEQKEKNGKLVKIVVIDQLSKEFCLGEIKEKELIESLQKDLEIDAKKAEEIAKEIITKIVPLLQKVTEAQLNDPSFVDDFAEKYFDEKRVNKPTYQELLNIDNIPTSKEPVGDLFPKVELPNVPNPQPTPAESSGAMKDESPAPKVSRAKAKLKKVSEESVEENIDENVFKPAPSTNQNTGPDSYREPIG